MQVDDPKAFLPRNNFDFIHPVIEVAAIHVHGIAFGIRAGLYAFQPKLIDDFHPFRWARPAFRGETVVDGEVDSGKRLSHKRSSKAG
jgi:hypothetical protein